MNIHICALSLEEAEILLKILDKVARRYYNTHGAYRRTSYPARANEGVRAVIEIEMAPEIWEYIRTAVMTEATRLLRKSITTCYTRPIDTWEYATEEVL